MVDIFKANKISEINKLSACATTVPFFLLTVNRTYHKLTLMIQSVYW